MENGNGLLEVNLENFSYCFVCGKYILGIKVKVLGKKIKGGWEKKFKIIKYFVCFFNLLFFYNFEVRFDFCFLLMLIL